MNRFEMAFSEKNLLQSINSLSFQKFQHLISYHSKCTYFLKLNKNLLNQISNKHHDLLLRNLLFNT